MPAIRPGTKGGVISGWGTALPEKVLTNHELAEMMEQAETRLEEIDSSVPSIDQARRDAANAVQEATRELARVEAALLALQNQQARLDNNNRLAMWLSKHQLENAPRLWQAIKIEQGWEDALEAALGVRLNAIKVTDRAALPRLVQDAPPGSVAVYVDDANAAANAAATPSWNAAAISARSRPARRSSYAAAIRSEPQMKPRSTEQP